MSLITVYRGVATTAEVYFTPTNSNIPTNIGAMVTYKVYTFSDLLISSGPATQDMTNPQHWTANFTVPASAPLTTGNEAYYIVWTLNLTGFSANQTNYFTVVDDTVNNPVDSVVVAMVGQSFNINLQLPYPSLGSLSLRIVNANDTVLLTKPGLSGVPSGQNGPNYVYSITVSGTDLVMLTLPGNCGGLNMLMAYINYTDPNGIQHIEVQPVYLANAMCISLMNDTRKYMDLLRNNDVIAQLRYTEANLLHFVFQGINRFNGAPPQWILLNFTILQQNPKAQAMYYWVLKCAQLEIAEAMTLAEGMTAFDFQGMTVQLNSDRTQYLNNTIDRLRSDLEKLEKIKMQCARGGGFSGRIGTLGGVFGPNANFIYRIQPLTAGGVGGGFGGYPILPFLG